MSLPFTLETPRLLLREFSVDDAQGMFEMNNDPDVVRFSGDKPFASLEATVEFIKAYNPYQQYGFGRWTLLLKEKMEYLGWCGLKYLPEIEEYDLGYRLLKQHRSKGYATEAGRACLDAGFNKFKLEKIVGRALKENVASIHVLKKLGMKHEKDFTDHDGECEQYYITHEMFLR